tara:strand:+ start:1981 stop:6984 length:5004 start_codon:yes stop_codon:yes gene_type:complete
MGEVKNAFIKSKMNKDLDSRLLPKGEYRNAVNVQVSRSESSDVGSLENVLGNSILNDFAVTTGVSGLSCIGFLADNANSIVYLFFTDYSEVSTLNPSYNPDSNNFIFSYNTLTNTAVLLVEGSFLNFSKTNPIYGVNLLENLLFWTDNRNQPRKINVALANKTSVSNPTYYTSEDNLSVAKYNPYSAIQTYEPSILNTSSVGDYESTLKDVVSLYYPNGGVGTVVSHNTTTATINNVKGDLVVSSDNYNTGASVSYIDTSTGYIVNIDGATIDTAIYSEANSNWEIAVVGATLPALTVGQKLVFNANAYYDPKFTGDPSFLEDKFVRFAYRFKFDDGENSLFSTFTQTAFIPKQDGYFMYVDKENLSKVGDESNAFRSSVVTFVENKVNKLDLRIPLPFPNYNIRQALHINSIDILYKESDGVSVKAVDTINIDEIENSSGVFTTLSSPQSSEAVLFTNLQGGVKIGEIVRGAGIVGYPTVVSVEYDSNSTTSGTITLSSIQSISTSVELTIGDPNFFVYTYNSKKPYKTLPSNEIVRVYDKVPVRALAQEVISNRVVYGNFQDKHTPPSNLDYNVLISEKSDFNLNKGSAIVDNQVSSNSVSISSPTGIFGVGSKVIAPGVPLGTVITSTASPVITLSKDVTLSVSDVLTFEPVSKSINTTSSTSHPSSSLKTNRTYQVGIVLADRYGRQSTTILSNNSSYLEIGENSFSGSTLFSPYIDNSIDPISWLGNSIKLSINSVMGANKNFQNGEPGVYNGEIDSVDYNPTGWYSFKIVVKQNEQEYYNIYLPGIMASYPTNDSLELGSTSHIALISDNINKVPRDLTEIGPDQKLYRSSVQLFGRVQNSSEAIELNIGEGSMQYFPGTATDTVTVVAAMDSLFDYDTQDPPSPNLFPQFYSYDSNPLIAKVNTHAKIGQIATNNFFTFSGIISITTVTDSIKMAGVTGDTSNVQPGDNVTGVGLPEGLKVDLAGFTPAGSYTGTIGVQGGTNTNEVTTSGNNALEVGDTLSGAGIEPNTFVLDVVRAAGGSPMTLTLNKDIAVANSDLIDFQAAAKIAVTTSFSMSAGEAVTVSSFKRPGIQELAIYETEPVVSSLDIFWETSTTGLVGEINNIILTSSGDGLAAAGINSYNTTPFTEALWPTQDSTPVYPAIFTSPIYLINAFGQQIPVAQISSPLTIASVISNNSNVTTYFNLEETTTSGEYNVVTTQDYMDSVYFSATVALNSFTFNFTATVNGQSAAFSETINLANKEPIILIDASEQGNHTSTIATGYISPSVQNVITLVGYNGSADTVIDTANPPPNRTQDLTWSIQSQTSLDGTDVQYFAIDPSTGAITNTGYQNTNMPADSYTITVKLSDPSLFVTRNVQVNMGLEISSIAMKTLTGTLGTQSGGGAYTKTWVEMYIEPRIIVNPATATIATIVNSNTVTVSNVSGVIVDNMLAITQKATAKVDGDVFFSSQVVLKDVVGTISVGDNVSGEGVTAGTTVLSITGNTINTNNMQPWTDDTEIIIGRQTKNTVDSVSGNTITFNNFLGSLNLAVGDEVFFELVQIDLAAGWYFFTDTSNANQTDPWSVLLSESGTPVAGGVIPVPCGGCSAGRQTCYSWNREAGTYAEAIVEFRATCMPTLFTRNTNPSSTQFNPNPNNFTWEYFDAYYLVGPPFNGTGPGCP